MLLYHETDRATAERIEREGFGDEHGSGATRPGFAYLSRHPTPRVPTASKRGWLVVVDLPDAEQYVARDEHGPLDPEHYEAKHSAVNACIPFRLVPAS